jgi:hypothetical protein
MNVDLHPGSTQAAEGLPRRRFTVAEVEAMVAAGIMDEDERVELIGGELAPMSAKGVHHEALKVALNDHWVGLRSGPVSSLRRPRFAFRTTRSSSPIS